ncbi:MAG: hypothetical protein WDZ91_04560 [Paenibacillaceae bacterium]
MNVRKSILYLVCALGMLLYALPRLEVGNGLSLPTIFGVIWIGVALLIIAAHLRVVLRVDNEYHEKDQYRHMNG